MVIRKPYAFLIKYFKIIHIILFIFMAYLLFKIRALYIFFKDFLATGTYTYVENIASKYINIPMILMSIILIALLLLIFFLMRQKKKQVLYYISATIFYFLAFVLFLYYLSVFNNLEFQTYSNQSLVLFRDFAMVLYYANYLFLGVAFVRGFGFNIKKFNFEKDIKELDITEADREEIEVGGSIDLDKVSNYMRRKKRNFMYYFKENSFVLIVFGVIVSLSVIAYFSLNSFVFNKTYHEGESIESRNVNYVINGSYLTNKDKYGNIIKNKNTYYLIIDFNVLNNNKSSISLDIKNTRIKMEDEYFYPKYTMSSKFSDLGVIYKNQTLKSKVDYNYIVYFEIENPNVENVNLLLELYDYKKVNKGEAILHYKKVKLNPFVLKDIDLGTYKLTTSVDLKNSYLKKGSFSLNDYEILDIINYTYTKCDSSGDGKCIEYKSSIVPSSSKKLLKIYYTSSVKTDFFKNLSIEYEVNNIKKRVNTWDIKNVTPSNYLKEGEIVLEIPNDLDKDLKFIFNLWGGIIRYE